MCIRDRVIIYYWGTADACTETKQSSSCRACRFSTNSVRSIQDHDEEYDGIACKYTLICKKYSTISKEFQTWECWIFPYSFHGSNAAPPTITTKRNKAIFNENVFQTKKIKIPENSKKFNKVAGLINARIHWKPIKSNAGDHLCFRFNTSGAQKSSLPLFIRIIIWERERERESAGGDIITTLQNVVSIRCSRNLAEYFVWKDKIV